MDAIRERVSKVGIFLLVQEISRIIQEGKYLQQVEEDRQYKKP